MAKGIDIKVDIISDPNGTAKVKREVDKLEREVIASAKRIESNKKATSKAIIQSEEAITRAATKESKARANALISELKKTEQVAKSSSTSIQQSLKNAFGGGLIGGAIGGFAGSLAASFTASLSQLPTIFKQQIDEMVKIAADRQNAFKGLGSLASFLGITPQDTQLAVKNLRLVRAGIVDIGDAATGLKNLLASGFSLPEAIKLLEAFSDTAAYGKSAALDFGEAIRGATEGIRNGNSILVDNVGLTKNLSAILKDAGFAEKDLSRVKEDHNVRQALFNGLLKEALPQMGDADKLTKGWTGSVSALTTAKNNLYAAIGNVIINNKALTASIQATTGRVNELTGAIENNEDGWKTWADNVVTWVAKQYDSVHFSFEREKADLQEIGNLLLVVALGFETVAAKAAEYAGLDTSGYAQHTVNRLAEAVNKMGTFTAEVDRAQRNYNDAVNRSIRQQMGLNFGSPAVPGRTFGTTTFGGYRDTSGISTRWATDPKTGQIVKVSSEPSVLNAGGGVGTKAGRTRITKEDFQLSPQGRALVEAGERLGISPVDLATIISYETGGKFSTGIRGGKGGNYQGLIQFGPQERAKYGVSGRQSFEDQLLNSVVPFLKDRFGGVGRSTYGASILDLYKTINGGNPLVSAGASDGNGTIAGHVRNMLRTHQPKVLSRFFGGSIGNIPGLPDDVARALAPQAPTPLTTSTPDITREIDLSSWREQIKLGEQQIAVYEELQLALFNLVERTKEETFWFDYKLGKYPQFNEEQAKDIANTYALIDAKEKQSKIEAENTRQLEEYRREQEYLFEETRQGWDDLLTDLAEGNFKSIWDRMRRQMLDSFIKPASQMLAQLFSGQPITAGGFGGQSGGFGGLFGGLFGGGSSSGMGPGGTPMFNPGSNFAGGGTSGFGGGFGGLGSMFGGLFGRSGAGVRVPGGTTMTMPGGSPGGGLFSKLGGMGGIAGLAGMGLTLAGGALGGKTGNMLSMAGMGTMIGLQFGGPWGALIGGAIGAGAGLISMLFGRDNAEKKLKEAALNTYGITVKDKSVLKTLKALGETMFGKGNVGKNAAQVVSSDEGQLILRNYAEATNQSSSKIDRLYIGDETWKGNQFRSQFGGFRAMGGPVDSGRSYIVGENGPELFTPGQSGSVTSNADMGQMAVILGALEETVHMLATRLRELSPGTVLSMGAKENPEAVGRAVRTDNSNSLRSSEMFLRTAGAY